MWKGRKEKVMVTTLVLCKASVSCVNNESREEGGCLGHVGEAEKAGKVGGCR